MRYWKRTYWRLGLLLLLWVKLASLLSYILVTKRSLLGCAGLGEAVFTASSLPPRDSRLRDHTL